LTGPFDQNILSPLLRPARPLTVLHVRILSVYLLPPFFLLISVTSRKPPHFLLREIFVLAAAGPYLIGSRSPSRSQPFCCPALCPLRCRSPPIFHDSLHTFPCHAISKLCRAKRRVHDALLLFESSLFSNARVLTPYIRAFFVYYLPNIERVLFFSHTLHIILSFKDPPYVLTERIFCPWSPHILLILRGTETPPPPPPPPFALPRRYLPQSLFSFNGNLSSLLFLSSDSHLDSDPF